MGALNAERLQDFLRRYEDFVDPDIPKFMYGSHYSTAAGVVLHYLVRLEPYARAAVALQGGRFDKARADASSSSFAGRRANNASAECVAMNRAMTQAQDKSRTHGRNRRAQSSDERQRACV